MRKILTKQEADELIRDIPNEEINWIDNIKDRDNEFKDIIHNYDCDGFIKWEKLSFQQLKVR